MHGCLDNLYISQRQLKLGISDRSNYFRLGFIFVKESLSDKDDYFKKLEAGIKVSLEYKIKTHINIIINVQSIEKIHLFASYAEQSGWIYNPKEEKKQVVKVFSDKNDGIEFYLSVSSHYSQIKELIDILDGRWVY